MARAIVRKGFLLIVVLLMNTIAHADSAMVLPKGVASARLEANFYFPIDTRFNENGNEENPAVIYNANLNSSVFAALALLEEPNLPPPLGLPPGTASLGTSIVHYEYEAQTLLFSLHYGLTDRLMVGVKVPYFYSFRNKVDARLDNATATVGKNAALNSLAPLSVPGTVPLTTNDIQELIGKGLDINGDGTVEIPGYGYKRVESWKDSGLSDIETWLKYKYFESSRWRLAIGGGVRFPTGEVDDPDSLVDYGFGNGVYGLLFALYNDLLIGKNLTFNATVTYDWLLPAHEVLRVPASVDEGLTLNKEDVDRDMGDVINTEFSGTYSPAEGLSITLLYKYGTKMKDKVSGNRGFNYKSLEDETDAEEQVYVVGAAYSTVARYLEKKFPIPLSASIAYRNRFAGKNNVLKSEYVQLGLQIFF